MTADSNYEIRLLGAKVILNMAQQNTTQTKDRLSSLACNCPCIANTYSDSVLWAIDYGILMINIKKSFLEMIILSSAKEKNLEIKSIYNLGKFSFAKK